MNNVDVQYQRQARRLRKTTSMDDWEEAVTRSMLSVLGIAALLTVAASGHALSEDFNVWRKNFGATAGKGGASAQPKGGGNLGAPAGRGTPIIEGGGSFKQPCGMGHLGCLDGDPPSGKGFNPKK